MVHLKRLGTTGIKFNVAEASTGLLSQLGRIGDGYLFVKSSL